MRSVILLALVLAGCASEPPPDYSYTDNQQCTSFGFKTGTEGYANCRMQLSSQRTGIEAQEQAQKNALIGQYLLNKQH